MCIGTCKRENTINRRTLHKKKKELFLWEINIFSKGSVLRGKISLIKDDDLVFHIPFDII